MAKVNRHRAWQQKQAEQVARDREILRYASLPDHSFDNKRQTKLTAAQLARYIDIPLDHQSAIRSADSYRPKHWSLLRQVVALINHVFVRYPVPLHVLRFALSEYGEAKFFDPEPRLPYKDEPSVWDPSKRKTPSSKRRKPRAPRKTLEGAFLRAFLHQTSGSEETVDCTDSADEECTPEDFYLMTTNDKYSLGDLQQLFINAAQGVSLAEIRKGLRVSRKELHWMLKAPSHFQFEEAFCYGSARASNLPPHIAEYVAQLLPYLMGNYLCSFRDFVFAFLNTHWEDMVDRDLHQVCLFFHCNPFARPRTPLAVRRRIKELLRREIQSDNGPFKSWPRTFTPWCTQRGDYLVRAQELTDSQKLKEEGLRQKSCVGQYVETCIAGDTKVISFRWVPNATEGSKTREDFKRVTVAVSISRNRVTHVLGKMNRAATDSELFVLRQWAEAFGLHVDLRERFRGD